MQISSFLVALVAADIWLGQAQPYACDDDRETRFSDDVTGKTESCVWLAAASPEQQDIFCAQNHSSLAFYTCRETCGACTDACEDSENAFFLHNGTLRDCLWLSLRSNDEQDKACADPTSPESVTCPETCNICDEPATVVQTDVVIIGAGAAGIAAAARIKEVDPSLKVTVLEAIERIGGRVWSEFGFGVEGNKWTIENGANWIYSGTESYSRSKELELSSVSNKLQSNTVYVYSPCNKTMPRGRDRRALHPFHAARILTEVDNDESLAGDPELKVLVKRYIRRLQDEENLEQCSAELIPEEEVDAALITFSSGPWNCTGDVSNQIWCEEVDADGNPIAIDIGVLAQLLECGYDHTDPLQFLWKWLTYDYSWASKFGSIFGWNDSWGQDAPVVEIVTDQDKGFEYVIQSQAAEAGIEPLFNQFVFKIKYDHHRDDYRALVYSGMPTGDLTVFETKRVISTLPAEVLNLGIVEFEPPLRYSADDHNPMQGAAMLKIFYQFPAAFWDDGEAFIMSIKEDDELGVSLNWINLNFHTMLPGSNMLLLPLTTETFEAVVGSENLRAPEISEEKLASLLDPLRIIYNGTFEEPVAVHYSKWHANIYTGYAAYTNWAIGYDPYDYYAFFGGDNATNDYIQAPCEHNGCNGDPEDDSSEWILYLSGSASCLEFWEFVHGGIYSGEVAANYMLQSLNYTDEQMGLWHDVCYYGLDAPDEAIMVTDVDDMTTDVSSTRLGADSRRGTLSMALAAAFLLFNS